MSEMPIIRTIGPPPERYADRIVAAMLRSVVPERAARWEIISDIFSGHSCGGDGNPMAQARMAEKMRRAGAANVVLRAGKRAKYEMDIYDWGGWDADLDKAIGVDDRIPAKPQLVYWMNTVKSKGDARYEIVSTPVLFITHHALSRFVQRLHEGQGDIPVTIEVHDLLRAVTSLWNAAVRLIRAKGGDALNPPHAGGWRIPFENGVAIINKHEARRSLIVATILPKGVYHEDLSRPHSRSGVIE